MKDLSVNTKYTLGIFFWMGLYMAALFGSILAIKAQHPTGAWLYFLAVLPALPIGGTLFVFMRHIDKVDEYVRGVILKRFILATGLTLFGCTAWGFIEDNASAPHMSLWMVFPIWWALFGFACAVYRKV